MRKSIVIAGAAAFLLLTALGQNRLQAQCLESFNLGEVIHNFDNLSDDVKTVLYNYYLCESLYAGDVRICDRIPSQEGCRQNCYNEYNGLDVIVMKWASKADYTQSDIEECVSKNYRNIEDEVKRRDDCVSLLKVYFGKEDLCAQESDPDLKASCYSIFHKDGSRCDTISDENIKNQCQLRAELLEIIKTGNKGMCADSPRIRGSRKWFNLCELFFSNSCGRQLGDLKRAYCSSSLP